MTAAGKLLQAERALKDIIKARDSNSFRTLDKAINDSRTIYADIVRWSRSPAYVVPLRPMGTNRPRSGVDVHARKVLRGFDEP